MSPQRSRTRVIKVLPAALVLCAAAALQAACAEPAVSLPAPTLDNPKTQGALETAVLAGGCFWGMQGVFEHVKGVTETTVGFAGGAKNTAHYERVSEGDTGHAESVRITYDPTKISYGQLLKIYFSVAHDPTEINRQGPDEGSQYRSEIFASTPEQEATARAYIAQLDGTHVFAAPIATKVEALKGFFPAEDYHQDYLVRNPRSSYIQINDLPKIAALKRVWPDMYREKPVLLAEN